jgi:type I restriction enzyme S subunit
MSAVAWPTVSLGEVTRLDLHREPIDPSKTYAMVGVLSFARGLFDREPIENGNTSYKYFLRLQPDHIVMSQLFGWEGALALSNERFAGKYLSPQFPTFLSDEGRLDRKFLGWLMRRPGFWSDLGTRASGMGDRRRTLNPDAFFACKIPLPPLDEQRRIVARIDELAAKVEEARTLRHAAEQEVVTLPRALLSHGKSKRTIRVGDFATLRPPDVAVDPLTEYHFAGVYSFGRGVFRGQRKLGSEFAYQKLTRLRASNFVYPKLMAWEGALGVVPPNCDGLVVSTEFPVFEIDEQVMLPEVMDTYFRSPDVWPTLSGRSGGTNVRRRRINPRDFLNLQMPCPSREAQAAIRECVLRASSISAIQIETAAELNAMLPAILDKAFKGNL